MAMPRLFSRVVAIAIFGLVRFDVVPAWALSKVTFVSAKGADSGNCASPTIPCRSFQYAISQTIDNGEIKVLDPGNYFPVTINRAISITGVEGAGIFRDSAGDAVTIGGTSFHGDFSVNLSNLILDGYGIAGNGITHTGGGSFTVKSCTVRNFRGDGIALVTREYIKFRLDDVTVADNGFSGLYIATSLGGGQRNTRPCCSEPEQGWHVSSRLDG